MNFDRFRVQTFIEEDLGCKDIKECNSYSEQFKSFKVNSTNKENLLSALKEDCADLYFNGVLSLAEGINGLYNNRHSWSVIKIYYAVFYLLKCSHGTNKIAFLKNKGIYTLKIDDNELPIKRDKKNTNR